MLGDTTLQSNGTANTEGASTNISPMKRTLRSSPSAAPSLKLGPAPPVVAPPSALTTLTTPLPHAPTRSSNLRQSVVPQQVDSPVPSSPAKDLVQTGEVDQHGPTAMQIDVQVADKVDAPVPKSPIHASLREPAPSTPVATTSAMAVTFGDLDSTATATVGVAEEREPSTPPPIKRVAAHGQVLLPRHPPDKICAFCYGSASKNRNNRPEAFVSCWECGSSGHPTCLEWDDTRMVKNVKSYAWLCIECKRCEICDEKGDDVSWPLFRSAPPLLSLSLSQIGLADS